MSLKKLFLSFSCICLFLVNFLFTQCTKQATFTVPDIEGCWQTIPLVHNPDRRYCIFKGYISQFDSSQTTTTTVNTYSLQSDTMYINDNNGQPVATWHLHFLCDTLVRVTNIRPLIRIQFEMRRE